MAQSDIATETIALFENLSTEDLMEEYATTRENLTSAQRFGLESKIAQCAKDLLAIDAVMRSRSQH